MHNLTNGDTMTRGPTTTDSFMTSALAFDPATRTASGDIDIGGAEN